MKKNNRIKTEAIRLLFLISIMLSGNTKANEKIGEWMLETDRDGIQVYVMNVQGTDIVKAKSITEIKATVEQVQTVLNDLPGRSKWVPFLKKSITLKINSKSSRLEYSVFSAPWPASNRDFLYSMQLLSTSDQQRVYEMRSVVNRVMPEINKLIRGEIIESRYTLTRIDNEVTQVELIYHADPKGWLPNWIINIIQKILPYKILKNLRHIIETNNYKNFPG